MGFDHEQEEAQEKIFDMRFSMSATTRRARLLLRELEARVEPGRAQSIMQDIVQDIALQLRVSETERNG